MLVTDLSTNNFDLDFMSPEFQEKLRELNNLRLCHPPITFESPNGPPPEKFRQVRCLDDLVDAVSKFQAEVENYRVFTLDLEGPDGADPAGLLFLPVGGTCVYVSLVTLVVKVDVATIRDALRFFLDAIESPQYLKVGSKVRGDCEELSKFLGVPRFEGRLHIFDTKEIVKHNKQAGLYPDKLTEYMGDKHGLKVMGLLHHQYDHKCYGPSDFKKAHGKANWARFPFERKILKPQNGQPSCLMYDWKRGPLSEMQRRYAYLDCILVVNFIIDSLYFAVQEETVDEWEFHDIAAKFFGMVFGSEFDPDRFGLIPKGHEAQPQDAQEHTPPRNGDRASRPGEPEEPEKSDQEEGPERNRQEKEMPEKSDDEELEFVEEEKSSEQLRAERKRHFEETGELFTFGKSRRIEDSMGLYSNRELGEIEEAMRIRRALLLFDHSRDASDLLSRDVLTRYLDLDFEETLRRTKDGDQKAKKKSKEMRMLKRIREQLAAKRDRAGPMFMAEEPIICVRRCPDCGGSHSDRTPLCPMARYHMQLNVLGQCEHARFFTVWPCLVCSESSHSTILCPVLHRLCGECHRRGHAKGQCGDANNRVRFERFAHIGLMTRMANGDDHHPWGFMPQFDQYSMEEIVQLNAKMRDVGEVTDVEEIYAEILRLYKSRN